MKRASGNLNVGRGINDLQTGRSSRNANKLPPCSISKMIEIENDESGISGILILKNPIPKRVRDDIIREWNKAPKLIIWHDNNTT
jgi:hypothetical protein